MKILIAYATIEGQTKKIAEHIEKRLSEGGHVPTLFNIMDRAGEVSIRDYDKVILAGSVHERRHPKAFDVFVSAHAERLSSKQTLFISVSMSAAFPEGAEEAADYAEEAMMRANFKPDDVLCLGGAIRLAKYDYYALQVLRHVVMRGRDFDQSQAVHEFTQWDVLDARLDDFAPPVEAT